MSLCKDYNWLTQLPLVLLGIKTTPNDALNFSVAKIVYEDPLVIPAEFLSACILLQLSLPPKSCFEEIYSKPPDIKALSEATHTNLAATLVFCCIDTSKPSLTLPYTGPFLMICHAQNIFLINVTGKKDLISIDHLKHVYLLQDDPLYSSPL
ncbi:uncharacterized protein [Palaemon carinicauda]|uniref:uncharacterized protein n=1 Tax=Palaemon carinicauda TaxID=392227 RepID=UPI0035B66854